MTIYTSIYYLLFVFQTSSRSVEISDYENVLCDDYDTNLVDDFSDLFEKLDLEYLLHEENVVEYVKEKYNNALDSVGNKIESTVTEGANYLVNNGDQIQTNLGNVKEKAEVWGNRAQMAQRGLFLAGSIPTPASAGLLAASSASGTIAK
ncbi:Hypothetical protein EIN_419230, partial [Entamoeba invadens IP1]